MAEESPHLEAFDQFLIRPSSGLIQFPEKNSVPFQIYLSKLVHHVVHLRSEEGTETKLIIVCIDHFTMKHYIMPLLSQENHGLRVIRLAARGRYCINEDVLALGSPLAMTSACNGMRNQGENTSTCPLYHGEENHRQPLVKAIGERQVVDIEDLKTIGKDIKVCSYFGAREMAHTDAEIVVTPYNYVLNQGPGTGDFYTRIFCGSILLFLDSDDDRALGLATPGNEEEHQTHVDKVSSTIHQLKSLEPRRMIFATSRPSSIGTEIRTLLETRGFEILPF